MKRYRWMTFFLQAILFFGVSLDALATASGSISSSPSHLVIEKGALGSSTISWTTSGTADAQVYVSNPGGQETLMAQGASGSVSAPWIVSGQTYVFRLYEGTAHSNILAWSSVTTQASPANTFGFDYWPAGHGDDTLYNANWPSLSPTVQADLDHISSLGGGVIRIFFWPQVSGFTVSSGNGGQFNSQLTEISGNLPSFLKLCADRNISVIVTFGNNYYSDNDPTSGLPWWAWAYGNTNQGFSAFLNDTATWMNKIVGAIESSPYANSVIYYDLENEYFQQTTNAQWYISFLYDWSNVPDGKRGVSVLNAAPDAADLAFALNNAAGPKLGTRHLDYVDFHSYITPQTYPNYVSNTPSQAAATVKSIFPDAAIVMGEFGYQTGDTSPNGSADTLQQQRATLNAINDAQQAGVSYYLNWLIWDAIAPAQRTPAFGANPNSPRDVMGGVSAALGILYNPDMEIVSNGAPAGWSIGGTVPATLSSQSGYGVGNASTNYNYARVSTSQTSGAVWMVSNQFPVKGGRQLFMNSYIRSSMRNVGMAITEYDQNRNSIKSDAGPTFNPTSWGFVNYLQQISSSCSGAAVAQDQCSWNVTLQPNTAYVIISFNAQPGATAPSYLDVDTVSAWQRP
ncbi:hypothetical protein [Dyella silvatica]|uniref:hypothetical protein n=1 Tax=Dyella silvatica TaxID=2992128 RepID=UPI00225058C9|nr:hypothetical protein [Dyella silvatica]